MYAALASEPAEGRSARSLLPAPIARELPPSVAGVDIQEELSTLRDAAEGRDYGRRLASLAAELLRGDMRSSEAMDAARALFLDVAGREDGKVSQIAAASNASRLLTQPPPHLVRCDVSALERPLRMLEPGSFAILAARPSMGKSRLARQITRSTAEAGTPVLSATLEEPPEKTLLSWAAQDGHPVNRRLSDPEARLSPEEMDVVLKALSDYTALPVEYVVDPSFEGLVAAAYHFAAAHENAPFLLVIDYIQLLDPPKRKQGYGSREQEVSAISRALKRLASRLGIVVLATAQIHRGVESRQDKRPLLSDLRESGALEQDADMVMFLYRENYYDSQRSMEDAPEGPEPAEIIIAKLRDGQTGTVYASFDRTHGARFLDADTEEVPVPQAGSSP